MFLKNYEAMKNDFKVYIYPDGDPKTYYQTPRKLTGKYCSEGYFFQNIRESHFRTDDPDKADLFFVPISPHKMRGMVINCLIFLSFLSFYKTWLLLQSGTLAGFVGTEYRVIPWVHVGAESYKQYCLVQTGAYQYG